MAKIITDKNKIEELLSLGSVDLIVKESLRQRLYSGCQLRIKHGIDPTGPKIHLGRASTMRKLARFQELGHKIVLIVGDFTAQIGDASDKNEERPMLTREQVKKNLKNYLGQINKILDIKKAEVHYNSQWLAKLNYYDFCRQANIFSVAQMLDRENFSQRFKTGVRISLREFLYPLMQGYDSVAIKADIEIGGSDQLFNMLAGRELQRLYGQLPQDIITYKLLDGTDGRKMSTSWGNIILITDEPNEMFGKIMSMKDELMIQYFELATDVPMPEIKEIENKLKNNSVNPRDIKIRLALEIVSIYHGAKLAQKAKENFEKVFQKKETPEKVTSFKLQVSSYKLIDLLIETKLAASKNEARRVIEQGGVKIDDQIIKDPSCQIEINKKGKIIQKGKRQFVRVIKK
ncbi:MAG: tyrosine--tRNA ligase [bacterium]